MTDISSQQEAQIRELIGQRRMIDAIKLYREATGVGLKEAKDAVTEMWHGRPVHPPPMQPGLGNDALLEEQIKQLLAQRQKIQAVKIYREAHNCGLKDAKDAVDIIEAQMRRETRTSLPSAPAISNDPFAEEAQRNRRFLVLVLAIVLIIIAGLAVLFLTGSGF
jgi:ribosomal protein L7/L12